MELTRIERYVGDRLEMSGIKSQSVGLVVYTALRHVLMAVGIHETMTSEERMLFEHMRKETQQYFASKFNLKERKRSKEKKNLPPRPLYKEKETKEKRSKTHPPSATRVRLFIRSVGATSKYMIVIHLKTSTISGAKRIRRLARCDFRGSAIGTPKRG